ncbi:MAG: hypothetical protein GY700_00435, partial [Propionibacteriaceae bacterium]|nr:hypothetical protein [Propionibacteriaceae bacterium]
MQQGLKVYLSTSKIFARTKDRRGLLPQLSVTKAPYFGPRGGTMVLNVNPIAGTIQCHGDGRFLGTMRKPYKPKGGKFLLLTSYCYSSTSSSIESLRVWKATPLSDTRLFTAVKAQDMIVDADGKRIPVGKVSIVGGQVVGSGGARYAVTDVLTIIMAKGARVEFP